MKVEAPLERVIPVLERAQVTYMLTGSVASSVHGALRSTQDLDIVISASLTQLQQMIADYQTLDFYADEAQAAAALASQSQFNLIDHVTGWKVDFIFSEKTEYGRRSLERRETITLAGLSVQIARAEDVVIAKLRWAKISGSARQIEDVAGMLKARRNELDTVYIEQWVEAFHLTELWARARE